MSKTTKEQHLRVAQYAMKIADDNGKLYRTSDKEIATLLSLTLCRMTESETVEKVEKFVEASKKAFKIAQPSVGHWAFMCMFANWLSWAWHHEGNEELTEAWAKAWYQLHDFSLETLKDAELKTYLEIVD